MKRRRRWAFWTCLFVSTLLVSLTSLSGWLAARFDRASAPPSGSWVVMLAGGALTIGHGDTGAPPDYRGVRFADWHAGWRPGALWPRWSNPAGGDWIDLPLWMFAAPFVIGAVWSGRRLRAMRGCCPSCGYDLGTTRDRCPECGRLVPSPKPRHGRIVLLATAVCVIVSAALAWAAISTANRSTAGTARVAAPDSAELSRLLESLRQIQPIKVDSAPYWSVAYSARLDAPITLDTKGCCLIGPDRFKDWNRIRGSDRFRLWNRHVRLPVGQDWTITPVYLGPDLLGVAYHGVWDRQVRVLDENNTLRLNYTNESGVDNVAAADLDGDGIDEVIIGFNGSTGIHAAKIDGGVLWTNTSIGNVRSVDAGDIVGGPALEVVAVSNGRVHVLDDKGNVVWWFSRGIDASWARIIAPPGGKPGIAVFGSNAQSLAFASGRIGVFEPGGTERWVLKIPINHPYFGVEDVAVCRSGRWLAWYFSPLNAVIFINGETGRPIAYSIIEIVHGIGWDESRDPPVLVAASGRGLFEVHPEEAAANGADDPPTPQSMK